MNVVWSKFRRHSIVDGRFPSFTHRDSTFLLPDWMGIFCFSVLLDFTRDLGAVRVMIDSSTTKQTRTIEPIASCPSCPGNIEINNRPFSYHSVPEMVFTLGTILNHSKHSKHSKRLINGFEEAERRNDSV